MTATSAAVVRPPNATKNPFTQIVRPPKRPIEESEVENFIWGAVQQPVKRSRISESPEHRNNCHAERSGVAQGEPGKPPPGYKCRRCDSTEVCVFRVVTFVVYSSD